MQALAESIRDQAAEYAEELLRKEIEETIYRNVRVPNGWFGETYPRMYDLIPSIVTLNKSYNEALVTSMSAPDDPVIPGYSVWGGAGSELKLLEGNSGFLRYTHRYQGGFPRPVVPVVQDKVDRMIRRMRDSMIAYMGFSSP